MYIKYNCKKIKYELWKRACFCNDVYNDICGYIKMKDCNKFYDYPLLAMNGILYKDYNMMKEVSDACEWMKLDVNRAAGLH